MWFQRLNDPATMKTSSRVAQKIEGEERQDG